ncbi:hypothetical protein QF034_002590 [Streptomyces africanus]|uniref:Uncharacterized protein n=1 Tax=Streptomyces africanus TaxID=231024 RepID=A0ABU0QLV6_9ACTN|nr:hypothetical protein [Streptomyces africanus]
MPTSRPVKSGGGTVDFTGTATGPQSPGPFVCD